MLLIIIVAGCIVFGGLLLMVAKMPGHWLLKLLNNPGKTDIAVFVVLNIIHGGTFLGIMTGGFAAIAMQITLYGGRLLFGSVRLNKKENKVRYHRGLFDKSDWQHKPPPPEMEITNKREFL